MKLTLDNIPKTVERLEQKKKLHEMCAQVMLDVKRLESQQKLILSRFKENSEILTEVKEGMETNLKVAKANVEMLKSIK